MKPVLIIQNVAIESPGTVLAYLKEREIPYKHIHSYEAESYPALDEVSAIVNLGCPTSLPRYREHEFLVRLFNYVSSATREDTPYLGICYGGQLLAHILGARVERNDKQEIGTYTVRVTAAGKADPLFAGLADTLPVFHWHNDTFRVPTGAELLIEGDDCRNQAFRLGQMVAVQFHLEAMSTEIPAWCEAYTDELAGIGKTKDQVVSEYKDVETQVRTNNFRFLDNFFQFTGVFNVKA